MAAPSSPNPDLLPTSPSSIAPERIALSLFAVYFVIYAGYVLINAFSPATMGVTVFAGINLATAYGVLLIILAFVLAMIYLWIAPAGK